MNAERRQARTFARFDAAFLRANRALIVLLLAAMALMVFANVALRFLTDHSILWVDEVSRYAMIWLTFLGAGLVLRHGGHIGIDALQVRFPARAAAIRSVIFALLLVFCAFVAWIATRYALLAWTQTTPVLQIPVGLVYLALPIGFALLIAHLLLMASSYIRRNEFIVDDEFDSRTAEL
ncbi:MAG TPA: TRAP transporter small permease [Casimicrobiaceae bacterium]|jgi:TRAP-type C4-dicarboxylate transport system permease small subunit